MSLPRDVSLERALHGGGHASEQGSENGQGEEHSPRGRRRERKVKVPGSLFFVTFVFLASCGDERPSKESENHTGHSFTDSGILAIERTRAEADRQLFNDEREAQRYEVAFVRLWDAMRLGKPFAALANFSFTSLSFPQARDPQPLSYGPYPVQGIVFAGPTNVLTPEIARKILASAKAA
ncbi:uncharacterized protein METZ01_LOCUS381547, partial [marine metagenome]